MTYTNTHDTKATFSANHNETGKLLKPGDTVIDTSGDKLAVFVRAEHRKIFIRYQNSDEILEMPPGRFSLKLRENKPAPKRH